MNLTEALSDFNSQRKNNYKYEIDNFIGYIQHVKARSIHDENTLNGIRAKDIIESLDYVIDEAGYTTYSMANKYKSAMSELFLYLIHNSVIQNSDLYDELVAPPLNQKSYRVRMNKHITSDKRLEPPKSIDALTEEEANQLIDDCDYIMNTEKNNLMYMSGCLSIKLMLLTGIKYSVLYTIPFSAYSNGVVMINGYKVHLPTNFNGQLGGYTKLVEAEQGKQTESLFVKAKGTPLDKKTGGSPLIRVMKELLGTTATMCLSKYGITNLIKADVNKADITDLTAAGMDAISDCMQDKTDAEREKYLNSRLSRLDVFYKL